MHRSNITVQAVFQFASSNPFWGHCFICIWRSILFFLFRSSIHSELLTKFHSEMLNTSNSYIRGHRFQCSALIWEVGPIRRGRRMAPVQLHSLPLVSSRECLKFALRICFLLILQLNFIVLRRYTSLTCHAYVSNVCLTPYIRTTWNLSYISRFSISNKLTRWIFSVRYFSNFSIVHSIPDSSCAPELSLHGSIWVSCDKLRF